MAYRTPDRAQETVTGTTTLTLAGSPSRNFRTLSAAGIADGDSFPGVVVHRTLDQWKSGVWQRSGSTIVLLELHSSSNGDADFTFGAGAKDVLVAPLGSSFTGPTVVTSGSSVTMTAFDREVIVKKTVGSATTVTLPPSPSAGQSAIVSDGKGDAATNNITVQPAAGTINGGSSWVIAANFASVTFRYSGTEWNVIAFAAP